MTQAPGLIMSPLMSPGEPAQATRMSASRQRAARSAVPVWQRVTVALSDLRDQEVHEGPAHEVGAADDDGAGALGLDAAALEELEDAGGRAGQVAGLLEDEAARR